MAKLDNEDLDIIEYAPIEKNSKNRYWFTCN